MVGFSGEEAPHLLTSGGRRLSTGVFLETWLWREVSLYFLQEPAPRAPTLAECLGTAQGGPV